MIDEALLKQKLGQNLVYGKNRLELKERVLMSKWISFYSMQMQGISGFSDEILYSRKEDLIQFYTQNLHISKSLETKLETRAAREQKLFGDATDELGIFFGGVCSKLSFWSSLLRYTISSNYDLAAKETVAEVRKYSSLDSRLAQTFESDIKLALSSKSSIMGTLDAMLACQQALAPVISQRDFAISKVEGNLFVSQKISAMPIPIKNNLSDGIALKRLHSEKTLLHR